MTTAIRTITIDDCLWLRHKILWPQHEPSYSRVEGDEQAQHYGAYRDDTLVSCLSVFEVSDGVCQIRKFATDHDDQRQGYGSLLMAHVLESVRERGIRRVTLNARLSASPFYARFGFAAAGPVTLKADIEYVVMQVTLA
ncbi:GNAT family N-acetyltransferase [Musicola paradisiaca]|uniref:GCN5-related N-acetyltransferase n=1 Tax=Musicola paradisiaca (strain Ech703) TaxID=579405 RepID=C6C8U9_MUSP7|nr:GNAT family N-acetyltransferase [Musicola paradisiaca]ACS84320.1 GCN5-related N-acetyltransferase [Musicola paradisiaca Ech703]